jgi:DNA-binding XRE family transcriptional regulator
MVRAPSLRVFRTPARRKLAVLPASIRRTRPRDFVEWKTLRRWERLPVWEPTSAGYLLREAREEAGLTQAALAMRLSCSQQAIAQAERWDSNPTFEYMERWAAACELRRKIAFTAKS